MLKEKLSEREREREREREKEKKKRKREREKDRDRGENNQDNIDMKVQKRSILIYFLPCPRLLDSLEMVSTYKMVV